MPKIDKPDKAYIKEMERLGFSPSPNGWVYKNGQYLNINAKTWKEVLSKARKFVRNV